MVPEQLVGAVDQVDLHAHEGGRSIPSAFVGIRSWGTVFSTLALTLPATFQVELTSPVEKDIITSPLYCPWSAKLTDLQVS